MPGCGQSAFLRGSPRDPHVLSANELVEHFFRREYGKLVASLSRRVGVQHIDAIEDAAQSALMTALTSWSRGPLPDNPSAWVFTVALNRLLTELRNSTRRKRILEETPLEGPEDEFALGRSDDELLRLLFICCDLGIPDDSQIVLALKIVCGFDGREIALRLFTSEENVYKRLERARTKLRTSSFSNNELREDRLSERLPAVLRILYLIFTEGYLSTHPTLTIRAELCQEALRLAELSANHPAGNTPETCALVALMHLHLCKMSAREDSNLGLLLLEEQDRKLFDRSRMYEGLAWLRRASRGDTFSRYHAEAGVAAEHCLAESFESTNWGRIASCYELLEKTSPSAIFRMNRAVAVGYQKGAEAGLMVLREHRPPTWLAGSYLWAAVSADLNRRAGRQEKAEHFAQQALALAPTKAIAALLRRRFALEETDQSR